MGTQPIVEIKVLTERSARLCDRIVGFEIDLFVFHAAPQPLDEDVVSPSAAAVHADRDAALDQRARECGASKLALDPTVAQRL